MAVKIQIKRGSKAGLPALAPGEYGLATDTAELFVGGSSGNLQIPVLDSTGKVPSSQLPEMDYDPAGSAAAVQASLTAHVNDEDNPHGVTAAQVGALPVTGGTLQGDLIIDQVSTTSHHTVDFQWREDTMSSFQFPVLRGLQAPTEADEAANKLYVDKKITTTTVTLKALNLSWSNNTFTVGVSGVTTSSTVIVSPIPSQQDAYIEAGIKCYEQGSGFLRFSREKVNESAIMVNVLIIN